MHFRYTIDIHIPDDPEYANDYVLVQLGRDGHQVERATSALVPALESAFDSLKLDVTNELDGGSAK